MDPTPSFPSVEWLHDAVVSVVTVGLLAFIASWTPNPVFNGDVGGAAWAAGIAAAGRAAIALISGVLNGTSSLKPHAVETATPVPASGPSLR